MEKRGRMSVHQVCILINMIPKQPCSRSGLGHRHTPAANCVRRVLAQVELSCTSEHRSKLSWVPVRWIGTLLKHKSLERKHLTFCYNHSPLRGMHKCKHGRINNDISFLSGNVLQNTSGGWKRMWHFQGVCCRMATKPKRLLLWLSQSTS